MRTIYEKEVYRLLLGLLKPHLSIDCLRSKQPDNVLISNSDGSWHLVQPSEGEKEMEHLIATLAKVKAEVLNRRFPILWLCEALLDSLRSTITTKDAYYPRCDRFEMAIDVFVLCLKANPKLKKCVLNSSEISPKAKVLLKNKLVTEA